MRNAKISVIVPVYGVEKHLDKCVESIVDQTYKNLEIILIDDGSPDNCPQMCDEWAQKDERIKVIHKPNGGVSSARNRGIDESTGDYVGFVDSDDWIETDMYELLIKAMQDTDADVSMCGFCCEDGDNTYNIEIPSCVTDKPYILKSYIADEIRPELCNKLYSKKLFLDNVRLNTEYSYAEDLLFNYYLLKGADRVVGVEGCKYHYLQNWGSSSTSAIMTDARAKSWRVTRAILDEQKNDAQLYTVCVWRHIRGLFALLNRFINNHDNTFYDKYFLELVNEVLLYKKEILFGRRFALKYKIAVALMMISPSLYAKVNNVILSR